MRAGGALRAAKNSTTRAAAASAAVDGSGAGASVRLVRLLPLTTPIGGSSVTVLWSKLSAPSAVFVGRPSLEKIGAEENALKSAWKDTNPPASGGKRSEALMLMSRAFALPMNVTRISLPVPKSPGALIVTS